MDKGEIDKDKIDNLNRQIMTYQAQGFNVLTKDEKTYMAIMEKEGEQNILIHVLLAILFFWLLFIPNIIYYFYAKKKKQINVFG